MFFIKSHEIHKLDKLLDEKDYVILIQERMFFFSKSQIAFLSISVMKHYYHFTFPFEISLPSESKLTYSDLISSMVDLESLFHSKTNLIINDNNVESLKFLSEVLDNLSLKKICAYYPSKTIFTLSSKHLFNFSAQKRENLNNFTLAINEHYFDINFSLLACISDNFFLIKSPGTEFICSIPQNHVSCFLDFMKLFEGNPFHYSKFDKSSLYFLFDMFQLTCFSNFLPSKDPPQSINDSIYFLAQFNFSTFETGILQLLENIISNIINVSVEQLLPLPSSHLYYIFSSDKLVVPNEDFLLSLIVDLIGHNSNLNFLLQTVHYEYVSSSFLKSIFDKLSFEEIDFQLFEALKQRLLSNAFLIESQKQGIYGLTSKEIQELSSLLVSFEDKNPIEHLQQMEGENQQLDNRLHDLGRYSKDLDNLSHSE